MSKQTKYIIVYIVTGVIAIGIVKTFSPESSIADIEFLGVYLAGYLGGWFCKAIEVGDV